MGKTADGEQLTQRQQKWFASVQASLERDTGKTLAQWVEIVRRDCRESRPGKRVAWLKAHYGLGVNRCAHILGEAFPSEMGWDDPDKLREALWTAPASTEILLAVEAAVADFDGRVTGQRKAFTAWSRKLQFAALKPARGGGAVLGLAVTPDASPRLLEPRNEGWSERLKAKLSLAAPADLDDEVKALLKAAWERS